MVGPCLRLNLTVGTGFLYSARFNGTAGISFLIFTLRLSIRRVKNQVAVNTGVLIGVPINCNNIASSTWSVPLHLSDNGQQPQIDRCTKFIFQ